MKLKDYTYYLIDLDGVLLNTKYDNYFWQEYIPRVYADKRGISIEDAVSVTHSLFNYKKKTLDWYNIDYWSNILNIDIEEEKKSKHSVEKIQVIDGSLKMLENLVALNKKVFLITNAHRKTLEIKMSKFNIKKFFDDIICSHELHYAKEDIQFWYMLKLKLGLDFESTVLVEDTYDNILSAYHAGLRTSVYINNERNKKFNFVTKHIQSFGELASCM